jgi:chloramphenicol-sensitive protein RarD
MDESTKGTISIVTAFFLWGIFPVYWKALQHVSSTQILAHRVVWSLVFVLVLLSIQRRWNEAKTAMSLYHNVPIFLVTSFLLGGNWLIYIWAVNSNQIVEACLGYFINPLVNVCLGMVFLRERLYRLQIISVLLAFAGVLCLTLQYGRLPWIALVLAVTFGIYGLLRKTARAESMVGLLLDTGFLAPIFLVYLIFLAAHGSGALVSINLRTDVLLIGAGVVTAVPLLLFAYGARRIRYSTVGFLQYIAPTGQLLIGVFLYREQFTRAHAIAFGLVWVALLVYSTSTFMTYKRRVPP